MLLLRGAVTTINTSFREALPSFEKIVIASPVYNSDIFYAELLERKRHETRRTNWLRMEKAYTRMVPNPEDRSELVARVQ